MEWKNYSELTQDNNDMGNKYLLNLDENIDLNDSYNAQDDCPQDEKGFIYKNFLDQDGNDKMNYYYLLNNLDNSNNEYQYFNQKYDLIKPYINLPNQKNNNLDIPFLNEDEEKKINKLSSDINNDENKDKNTKNLFKIQSYSSTSKGDSNNQKNKESSNEDNNEYINNYQSMPLKERMKLKKEKAKKLLENKTQRMSIQEESKENNIDKNSITNNSQENISGYSNNNSIYNNSNVLNNYSLNTNIISKMSKKEIKMLRNRLSAQRSRDRKKKELIDLKTITKNLLQENEKLRNEIRERDEKINKLLNLLCPACKEKTKNNNLEIKVEEGNSDSSNNMLEDETQLTPNNIVIGKKKLALLMTGLFTIFCIFGAFMAPNDQNIIRYLKEKTNVENKNSDEKRVNVPFLIEKDYTIRHKKEIEMYQKIQKNNLKNKNLMVPASLFQNNSEQILSNINNSINNNQNNNNINKNKTDDSIKDIIHDNTKKYNNTVEIEVKLDKGKKNDAENKNFKIEDN